MKMKRWKTLLITAVLAGAMAMPAFAAEGWQEEDNTWYYYNEDGERQTGWICDPDSGLWYELDSETAAWVKKPVINENSVKYLLGNAVKRAGYYQNEEDPVEIVITGQDKTYIYASIRIITGPNSYTDLNQYEINKKTGHAQGVRGTGVELYQ
jgi:hypothetical protein